MEPTQQSVTDFIQTGLSAPILTALNTLGLTTPTPIQAQAIPVARSGHDVMGIAQTGTGKTFAFSLPIIEKLMAGPGKALVVVPTRELAIQVEDSIKRITRLLTPQLRTVCLIGGAPIYRQKQDLRANPRIIVATPGRMWDHIQQRTARLDDVTFVVLDEADRMLDMGFAPQIKQIMDMVSKERQTMCFSATMAPEIAKLAHVYMKEPLRIEVANAGESNAQIRQEMAYVRPEEKTNLLHTLLQDHEGLVLVFSRTKHGARKLTERVRDLGHTAVEIHSNRSLAQRRHALEGFRRGQYRVLIATDVAARGIDVNDIALVVNYDLPDAAEDYVHRIGRTGRAGKLGKAISLATRDQARDVQSIERLMRRSIAVSEYSDATAMSAPRFERSVGGGGGYQGGGNGGYARRAYSSGPSRPSAGRPSGPRRSGGTGGGGQRSAPSRFSRSR